MSRKSFIDSVEVKAACGEDWEKMTGNDRVRFCDHCAKHVENISTLRRKDAARFVRGSRGDLCIRYIVDPVTRRPMFADQLVQIARRTPGIAAGVMTAALSLSTMTVAQEYKVRSTDDATVERQSDDANDNEKDVPPNGAIRGTIRDFDGKPLAGVQLVLENAELQYDYDQVETDKNGAYQFEDLEPKVYMLRVVDHDGAWKKAAPGLTLSAGQTIVQDLNVKVTHTATAEVDSSGSGSGSGSGFGYGGAIAMVEYSLPLSRAVADNDVTEVQRLLDGGAKVDGRDENYDNITPLFVAVENGDVAIVNLLLQHGAAVNAADKTGRTPLMTIDSDATPELIDLLLASGARANVSDDDGTTPLLAAIGSGKTEIVDALLKAGADVNAGDKQDLTPLLKAVNEGDVDMVQTLIIAGADVNARDKDGATAWDKTSDPEIEKVLVESGALIDYDVTVEIDDDAPAAGR